jgi:hypothetical protein
VNIKTPVAVIVFNRPVHARKLRHYLNDHQTRELFVIVDGARTNKIGEKELVLECISAFKDWPGKVHFNISDTNLGCKSRISSGLNWVFQHTDRAIILEDDLSPSHQFLQFCDEMLETYANNDKVISVCGTKTYPHKVGNGQYFFSKYNNCWGWATWKSAWDLYDDKFDNYSYVQIFLGVRSFLGTVRSALYWLFRLKQVQAGRKSSWAYCWSVSGFLHKGFHIVPNSNLVVNQGFDSNSTHTEHAESYVPLAYGESLQFPLVTHTSIFSDAKADQWIEDTLFSKSVKNRILWFFRVGTLKKIMKGKNI